MKQMIKAYFYDFYRGFKLERLVIISYLTISVLYANWMDLNYTTVMMGMPVLFAVISGACHMVSLPFMMYLVPYNQEQRELYIQRMLYVKMLIPLGVALLCDMVAILSGKASLYTFILQIVSILLITYVCGTLNDGTVNGTEKKAAYGGIKDIVGLPLMLCYVAGSVMFMVCMNTISRKEFWVIVAILLVLFGPIVLAIRKRWSKIRHNFANYEIATKLEVR